jgi:opacity protein-like surface antigen
MSNMRRNSTLLALTAAALAAAPAYAQVPLARPITLGVAGGVALPLGDFGDGAKTGFAGMLSVGFQPPAQAFGLRVDGMYHRFGLDEGSVGDELPPGVDFDGNANILAGVASVVMTVSNAAGVRPYLIGGGGIYRLGVDVEVSADGETLSDDESQTDFGLAGGGGIAFPLGGFNAFVEARIHSVFSGDDDEEDSGNTNFIPVVVGITF